MKTTDLEFEYNERADGYIYVNEDKLETEVKELLRSGKDVEALRMNEEISREAYLCLTKKREAVLKWYHFKEESEILEIGAGYGELTEYLCRHSRHVTSYERKTERADIIKMRCQPYGNLDCHSGLLQDMRWQKTYDYIFLHDILALSRKFFKGEDASVEMLKFLLPYLKEDGKFIITVENRLGLKYFAGAAEEISSQFFWGLNLFDEDERGRTFSRKELERVLQKSGLENINWFYPYPDLAYPLEIYTDEVMDKMGYGISMPDYEIVSDRYQFFDEQRMFWALRNEGIANRFVNAFFVECSRKESGKQLLFADLKNGFTIKEQTEQGFIDGSGNLLPKGERLDVYLAGKLQETVNCNLGGKNPFISEIYDVFREIYLYLQKSFCRIQDFYYSDGKIALHEQRQEKKPASEYWRWELVYEWYFRHVMFYRNAKRRILLEDLLEIVQVNTGHIAEYLKVWKDKSEKHYITPRLSQNMFDFEAEAAKDARYFGQELINKRTLKDKLESMWSIGGETE